MGGPCNCCLRLCVRRAIQLEKPINFNLLFQVIGRSNRRKSYRIYSRRASPSAWSERRWSTQIVSTWMSMAHFVIVNGWARHTLPAKYARSLYFSLLRNFSSFILVVRNLQRHCSATGDWFEFYCTGGIRAAWIPAKKNTEKMKSHLIANTSQTNRLLFIQRILSANEMILFMFGVEKNAYWISLFLMGARALSSSRSSLDFL